MLVQNIQTPPHEGTHSESAPHGRLSLASLFGQIRHKKNERLQNVMQSQVVVKNELTSKCNAITVCGTKYLTIASNQNINIQIYKQRLG